MIYNASFRFYDTLLYKKYRIGNVGFGGSGFVHKFDKNNRKLNYQRYSEWFCIKETE